ncbi:MAG: D-alanine--D-alanine ligase [Planctomycetes bacterium]|nr:D-alanine--D-alanine ligase [Planctomycetota bacterium]
MKRLRVLHLTQPWMLPPPDPENYGEKERKVWKTDYDVVSTLRELGHEVQSLGVEDELQPIRSAIEGFKPHIVFNLVEAFAGMAELDQHVVSYLELLGVPYTGCSPRGLVLARSKALSKKILAYHRIRSPKFDVFPLNRKVRRRADLPLPLFVKSLTEESSQGISQASIVETDAKLAERVAFIHSHLGTDAIAEQYIEGRELYVGVVGNERVQILPTWEITFENLPAGHAAIATSKVKHNPEYQEKAGIMQGPAEALPPEVERSIAQVTRRIYRALEIDGYARIDYRLGTDDKLYFLEANPNPEIARDEELASSAEIAGLEYPDLIKKIVNLGLKRGRRLR